MEKELINYASNYLITTPYNEIFAQIESKNNYYEILNYSNKKRKSIYSKKDIIQEGKKFFNEYFTLNNIYYYSKKMPLFLIKKLTLKELLSVTEQSIFDIPITLNKTNELSSIETTIFITKKDVIKIIRKIIITNKEIARESYAHEISHSQISSPSNPIDFFNDEIIPIFIEQLAGQYFNQPNTIRTFRLNTLYRYLSELESQTLSTYNKIINVKYIESTLKAYLLYYLYQTESLTSTQARIIDEINELFKQEITLNQILNNHGITNDNYKQLTLTYKTL